MSQSKVMCSTVLCLDANAEYFSQSYERGAEIKRFMFYWVRMNGNNNVVKELFLAWHFRNCSQSTLLRNVAIYLLPTLR